MKVDLPVKVMLRCRATVEVQRVVYDFAPWGLFGRDREGPELWRRDGRWREDGAPSPRDIVAILDGAGCAQPLQDHFA